MTVTDLDQAGTEPPASPVTQDAAARTPYRWRWVVLGLVLLAEIMDLVDATIVNIALPSIHADLGGSTTDMQWMLAGYTLAFAISLVSFGRLGDLLGRRRLFVVGAAGFTIASVLCGLAASPGLLVGSRLAQGLLAAVFGALRFMPELKTPGVTRLDLRGATLLAVATGMLIYPLVQGRELGWPLWSYLLMAGSLPVFALFGWSERRSDEPVIAPSLFRSRGYVAGLGVITSFFLAMSGFMLVLNLFTQLGLHFSPLKAGLAMVPFSLGIAIGAPLSGGLLSPKLGRGALQLGIVVITVGMLGMWLTLHAQGDGLGIWDLVPATLVSGIGAGMVFAPLFDIILASVDDEAAGSASGVLTAVQQFGGTVGVAVIGTLFFELLPDHGFTGSMTTATLASTALFVLSLAVTYLLPRRAREGASAH